MTKEKPDDAMTRFVNTLSNLTERDTLRWRRGDIDCDYVFAGSWRLCVEVVDRDSAELEIARIDTSGDVQDVALLHDIEGLGGLVLVIAHQYERLGTPQYSKEDRLIFEQIKQERIARKQREVRRCATLAQTCEQTLLTPPPFACSANGSIIHLRQSFS